MLGLVLTASVLAAEGRDVPFLGRSVQAVIDDFRAAGHPFAYSTGLVDDQLVVTAEPAATEPFGIVSEILEPHGLTLRTIAGVHLVVRIDRVQTSDDTISPLTNAGDEVPAIEMIVVSASRYEISRDIASSRFQLDRRSIQSMPDVGDDPVRITQRLPGAAASGASAKSHFRGGNSNEVGIMLNGQWLFDPYHVRDYQSVFSAIDSRAISGVEVYTGGFPVRYGDRMSGLVLMESVEMDKPRHTEIGVSVFNTSVLTSGKQDGRQWLFSARRGNLDLVIDEKLGQPSYYDVFGEFALDLTDDTTLTVNALYADDRVRIVTESDPEELEQVVSATRNAQVWINLKTRWSDSLSSSTILSAVSYDNLRSGSTNDAEKMVSLVSDAREVERIALRQDWTWHASESHFVQWGLQAAYADAAYRYAGSAEYFGLPALYVNQPQSVVRDGTASPGGGNFAAYVSDRWRLTPGTTVEWGVRWDDQTYNDLDSDAQLSPRLNFLHAPNERTELRLTWGRYHQSQGVHELQIEDGVTRFWPAERSDHVILGLRRLIARHYSLRLEGFYKDMSKVRPRYENLFDPLGIVPEFQPDRVMLAPQSAEASGLELTLDYSDASWDWWATYTISRVTDRIDDVTAPRTWDQRHAFQGGLTWTNDRWTVSTAASVHSGWPTTALELRDIGPGADGEPILQAVPGTRNASRNGTFASVDIRVSRQFDVGRGSLLVFLEVSNLFNRRNQCCLDWDIAEDDDGNVFLESSRDYWLPRLPAVGILWEF